MICGTCGARGMESIAQWHAHRKACPGGAGGGWQRVAELKRAGQHDAAQEVSRSLLGIEGPKMSEEAKAKLRAYSQTPEAKERARVRRLMKQVKGKAAKRAVVLQEERKASYASRAQKRIKRKR